jgi:XTP/dITP diphosphohydrolase
MNLFLATSNEHKAAEFGALLAGRGLTGIIVRPATAAGGMPPVEETAENFEGNAWLKARAMREQVGVGGWVLADDSGLEVDALGGAPGVRSARYAGEDATDAAHNARLLRELEGKTGAARRARFRCVLALMSPDGREETFSGACEGRIAESLAGKGGFGYDPLFVPEGYERTFAELGESVKNRISHRARAWELLLKRLHREL